MQNFCSLEPTEKWKWKKFRRLAIKLKELILQELTEEILSNLGLPFKILKSLSKSKKIIKNFAPDFAVGTGGFASGPALYEASKLGIPIFIQEQNAHAGVTNKILSKKAKAVFTAYPKVEGFPAEKIKFLGNPIREILFQECRKPLRQKKKWA
jgi:UDP-N-acetylglucosamine--N-acetylmuramyl-(pentapeptide) pyrophosphoryl-undecaprenol N-acetylglucosamine transferase